MALIDDIEFYGRAVDSGVMPREDAVAALVKASNGGLTTDGATQAISDLPRTRAKLEKVHRDIVGGMVDSLRVLRNGKPAGHP